jgi:hypothetical protein
MALDLEASVSLGLGKLDDIHKGVSSLTQATPIRSAAGVANVPSALAAQTLVIPIRPAAGRMWYVHRVAILGADGHTSVASAVADIYAGPAGSLTPDATSQLYSGLTLPTIVEEGRYHNPVVFGECVYALLYNLPANQVVQFAIGWYDYPFKSVLAASA